MKIYSEDIYHLLYRLDATANYVDFSYLIRMPQFYTEKPERLLLVVKWLYPSVAKQYGTNWKVVEQSTHTVGRVIRNSNRLFLEDLAHRELSQKPCTAQLLAILHASPLPFSSSMDEEWEKFLQQRREEHGLIDRKEEGGWGYGKAFDLGAQGIHRSDRSIGETR